MKQNHKSQKTVLLVEDDFILAMDAEDNLTTDDTSVSVVSTVDTALDVISNSKIDYAIVDFQLADKDSKPVINKLKETDIPFAVVTGADLHQIHDIINDNTTVFRKPVDYKWVMRRLYLKENVA